MTSEPLTDSSASEPRARRRGTRVYMAAPLTERLTREALDLIEAGADTSMARDALMLAFDLTYPQARRIALRADTEFRMRLRLTVSQRIGEARTKVALSRLDTAAAAVSLAVA